MKKWTERSTSYFNNMYYRSSRLWMEGPWYIRLPGKWSSLSCHKPKHDISWQAVWKQSCEQEEYRGERLAPSHSRPQPVLCLLMGLSREQSLFSQTCDSWATGIEYKTGSWHVVCRNAAVLITSCEGYSWGLCCFSFSEQWKATNV